MVNYKIVSHFILHFVKCHLGDLFILKHFIVILIVLHLLTIFIFWLFDSDTEFRCQIYIKWATCLEKANTFNKLPKSKHIWASMTLRAQHINRILVNKKPGCFPAYICSLNSLTGSFISFLAADWVSFPSSFPKPGFSWSFLLCTFQCSPSDCFEPALYKNVWRHSNYYLKQIRSSAYISV